MNHGPRLLTTEALAARLGVSSCWLRRQADNGTIPCCRADKQMLFDVSRVEEILLLSAQFRRTAEEERARLLRVRQYKAERARAAQAFKPKDGGAERSAGGGP